MIDEVMTVAIFCKDRDHSSLRVVLSGQFVLDGLRFVILFLALPVSHRNLPSSFPCTNN